MAKRAYKLTMPRQRTTCVVFASPHSGRDYPPSFLSSSVLDEHTIRSSEDAYVDVLFEAAPRFGAPLLAATAPRVARAARSARIAGPVPKGTRSEARASNSMGEPARRVIPPSLASLLSR